MKNKIIAIVLAVGLALGHAVPVSGLAPETWFGNGAEIPEGVLTAFNRVRLNSSDPSEFRYGFESKKAVLFGGVYFTVPRSLRRSYYYVRLEEDEDSPLEHVRGPVRYGSRLELVDKKNPLNRLVFLLIDDRIYILYRDYASGRIQCDVLPCAGEKEHSEYLRDYETYLDFEDRMYGIPPAGTVSGEERAKAIAKMIKSERKKQKSSYVWLSIGTLKRVLPLQYCRKHRGYRVIFASLYREQPDSRYLVLADNINPGNVYVLERRGRRIINVNTNRWQLMPDKTRPVELLSDEIFRPGFEDFDSRMTRVLRAEPVEGSIHVQGKYFLSFGLAERDYSEVTYVRYDGNLLEYPYLKKEYPVTLVKTEDIPNPYKMTRKQKKLRNVKENPEDVVVYRGVFGKEKPPLWLAYFRDGRIRYYCLRGKLRGRRRLRLVYSEFSESKIITRIKWVGENRYVVEGIRWKDNKEDVVFDTSSGGDYFNLARIVQKFSQEETANPVEIDVRLRRNITPPERLNRKTAEPFVVTSDQGERRLISISGGYTGEECDTRFTYEVPDSRGLDGAV